MRRKAEIEALETAVEYAYACGIDGSVAEFGCYLGESAEVLARSMAEMEFRYSDIANIRRFSNRWLWLFDSLEGFPEATDQIDIDSLHVKTGEWRAGHMKGATSDELRFVCHRHFPRTVVISGWFKSSVPNITSIAEELHDKNQVFPARVRLAVVHIDCDLYESTMDVLDGLFEHGLLSDGATILFDDWYCNRGSPDFGEQRAWHDATVKYNVRYTDWGPYSVAGRRFIVHG